MSKIVYIAGPYTGRSHDYNSYFEIHRHITDAMEAAACLARAGVGFFCPHANGAHFEVITPEVPPQYWYELDEHFMLCCDAILMLPGWEHSMGSKQELATMNALNRPAFFSIDEAIAWANESR